MFENVHAPVSGEPPLDCNTNCPKASYGVSLDMNLVSVAPSLGVHVHSVHMPNNLEYRRAMWDFTWERHLCAEHDGMLDPWLTSGVRV